MKVLDWNKVTTYKPPDYSGSLVLAEWKAGECTVKPGESGTETNEVSTTAIIKTLTIQELLSTELLRTTPDDVAELYLLCQQDAAVAFAGYMPKLSLKINPDPELAWVANAFFYFREDDQVQTGTVNLLSGEVVAGMEHLLRKYPLTSQTQQPQAEVRLSLEQGLRKLIEEGLSTRKDDPASLQCLLMHRSTLTTHSPEHENVNKKLFSIERSELSSMNLPAPHLVSTAVIYTPLLLYALQESAQFIVYDPTIGHLYTSNIHVEHN